MKQLNSFFFINLSGQIKSSNNLDRETTSSYNLKITARDSGSPAKSATADVKIVITDVNDNRPAFNRNPFRFQVQENIPAQTSIGKIVATDNDAGTNAQLEYSLVGSGGVVSVDTNGDVKVAAQIDYEATKSYTYDIKVSDKGNPKLSSYAKLIIEVKSNYSKYLISSQSESIFVPMSCPISYHKELKMLLNINVCHQLNVFYIPCSFYSRF